MNLQVKRRLTMITSSEERRGTRRKPRNNKDIRSHSMKSKKIITQPVRHREIVNRVQYRLFKIYLLNNRKGTQKIQKHREIIKIMAPKSTKNIQNMKHKEFRSKRNQKKIKLLEFLMFKLLRRQNLNKFSNFKLHKDKS